MAIAQSSLAEVDSYFAICAEVGWIREQETLYVDQLITEVGKMLTAMRKSNRASKDTQP
jgi:four helix bundle protein